MQRITDTIQRYRMIEPGMKILAGVSGGADSVCLLTVLADLRQDFAFDLIAVHVEHGLRGEDSLKDAAFVERLCRSRDVPFVIRHIDVRKIAADRRLSEEEAGRMARYEIFDEIASEKQCDRIAVAHNRNDQAETVLWNLIRGCGLRGMGGIRPVRDRIIRPLLFFDRREIEEILVQRGIEWCTDRTNLETDYMRNRIRLNILPAMQKQINPEAVSHIAQAAGRLLEVQEYLDTQTEAAVVECLRREEDSISLILSKWREKPGLIQKELLKKCMEEIREGYALKDFGSIHLEILLALAENKDGKSCCLPGRVIARREPDRIRFFPRNGNQGIRKPSSLHDQTEVYLTPPGGIVRFGDCRAEYSFIENSPAVMEKIQIEKQYTKWLACDTISGNVCFRTRRPGDYLVINDSGGRKKLKDYLIDQKIPSEERSRLWLLADGSRILWVTGMRISEDAKIGQSTGKVLKIEINMTAKEEYDERKN